MKNQIRSEYIRNIVSEKDALKKKLEEMTNESLKDIVSEEVNKNLRKLISEADEDDDSYEEEEVEDIPTPDTDKESTDDDSVETGDEGEDLPAVEDDAEPVGGEEDGDVETDDDMWGDLEQYKDETGEFDLRNMDKDNVVKVLKLVAQDPANSVRVFKDDAQGTIVVNDDDTEKQYVIDIETADGADGVDVSTDTTDESKCGEGCNESEDKCPECGKDKKDCTCEDNNVNEDTGYTTDYQKQTAMTTPSNNEPAKSSETYSMDKGVPTGTEKPYGKAGNEMNPFEENVNEGDEFEIELDDENVEEATNVGGFAVQNTTAKSHVPNSNGRAARNQSKGGEYTSTQKPRYSGEQMEAIKRQANQIFAENKQLKGVVEELKDRINEAIVANYNLSRIIKLVTENSTTKDEKLGIINRFNNVRTLQEAKDTFKVIDSELKNPDRISRINNMMDKQLSESKNNNAAKPVVETKMYQSEDLQQTISLMARLDALDKGVKKK